MEESLPTETEINGEDGEEFYEKIEAPKFVDFTALDRYRPEHDDRYWFCLRVGCDQKHEEEIDPEAIYKNFVLRVMAARSPNVQLRKTLNGKSLSNISGRCPKTVPAKSSKSRMSRLAVISSISQKIVEAKAKVKPPLSNLNATPNARTKHSTVVRKALTTPRNKKRLSNPDLFRSVKNKKSTVVAMTKSKVVAKALVFNSPKKTIKKKATLELDTPIREICAGMKKLDIASEKKHILGYNKPLPLDASRRKLGAREVKSRVYDSLHNCKSKEPKSSRCLERNKKVKNLQTCQLTVSREGADDDSSDMDIDEKTRVGSLIPCSVSGTHKSCEECLTTVETLELPVSNDDSAEALSETSRENVTSQSSMEGKTSTKKSPNFQDVSGEGEKNNRGSDYEQQSKSSAVKGNIPVAMDDNKEYALASNDQGNESEVVESGDKDLSEEGEKNNRGSHCEPQSKSSAVKGNIALVIDDNDKENALASNDQEFESEALESEDKENVTASDDNRELNLRHSHPEKKVLGKLVTCKSTQKVTRVMRKKECTNSAVTSIKVVKYRKPKPTNPKPFRLRTDERRILKEANLEKKFPVPSPLKEIKAVPRLQDGNSHRKHQSAIHNNEKCVAQVEYDNGACEGAEIDINRRTPDNRTQRTKTSCLKTPEKRSTQHSGNLVTSQLKNNKHKAVQESEILKRTKSPSTEQVVRIQGVSSRTCCQLDSIKETSPTISRSNEATFPTNKTSSAPSRSSSRGRRPTTIPREPCFHTMHVPKSCTRKLH